MESSNKRLDAKDKARFDQDGFIVKKQFVSEQEIDLLYKTSLADTVIQEQTYGRSDKEGNVTNLALWYTPDDSIYSALARSERIVKGAELLLGEKVGHFHSKLMQKKPRVGGAWEWHQDYGYWYNDGFLMPQMLSVMTAFTPSIKENGCLQVLVGSHLIGRINHGVSGDQKGVDEERLEVVLKRFERVYVEMQPGDVLFFHSNLLHRSDMNRSENPRWSLITAYNAVSNEPFKGDYPTSFKPIDILPDSAILEANISGISKDADFKKV